MKKITNTKVAVGEFDVEIVAGTKAPLKPKNLMFRAFSSIIKSAPVEPDLILKEKDKVGPFTVIHVPSHSDGSTSLIDEQRKVLFVGDTLRYVNIKIAESPGQLNLDTEKAKESIGKTSTFDFDLMLGGHGGPLKGNSSLKVKDF